MAYRECLPAQNEFKVSGSWTLDRVFRDVGRRQAGGSCGVGAQQLYRPVKLWLAPVCFGLVTEETRLILVSDERPQ